MTATPSQTHLQGPDNRGDGKEGQWEGWYVLFDDMSGRRGYLSLVGGARDSHSSYDGPRCASPKEHGEATVATKSQTKVTLSEI